MNSIPHILETQTFRKPTFCDFCSEFLFGLTKQGVRCTICGLNFHKKCASEKHNICEGKLSESAIGDVKSYCNNNSNGNSPLNTPFESLKLVLNSLRSQDSFTRNESKNYESQSDTNAILMPHSFQFHTYKLPTMCQYCDSLLFGIYKQGLQCKDCKYNVHKKCEDKVPNNCPGEAPKSFSTSTSKSIVDNSFNGKDGQNNMDNNNVSSYCSSDDSNMIDTPNIPLMRIAQSIKVTKNGHRVGNRYGTTTPNTGPGGCSGGGGTTVTCGTDANELLLGAVGNGFPLKPSLDINDEYEFLPDDILGSGQFGVVYAGRHRTSHRAVAIKIIDKHRFPPEQESQLKNEESILKTISNPGIVKLEKMFETPERIFVVMEKLNGDMLDMIVNFCDPVTGEIGRLSERIAKFLIYQILIALAYLHKKNIVHCDLKPENVLLTTSSNFPQVKLCDFGFARIIGETSFRRSIVGTPAYLAPEVLRNKGYNRSLDMWSVGVIVYVSVSGKFPFNENEDINDQILHASFLFPPDIWANISPDAKHLIHNLLQVTSRLRFTVDQSLIHPWLNDYVTWCDLRELEYSVNSRWLTHESDDKRWMDYSIAHNLPPPAIPEPFGQYSMS